MAEVSESVTIRHIFISPGHNYFGRYGETAGTHGITDVASVKCRAGWGLEGDRFYGYRPGYNGQVTFFAWETYTAAQRKFSVPALAASAFRRNILVEGLDLTALIGRRFTLGGVEFEGASEARPCHWMNQAVAPGAEAWLRGNGGLRAKVLTDGLLQAGPVEVLVTQEAGATQQLGFRAPGFL